jgi:hypothetical protein
MQQQGQSLTRLVEGRADDCQFRQFAFKEQFERTNFSLFFSEAKVETKSGGRDF